MGLLDWLTSAERTQQMQGFGNNLKGAIEQLKQQRGLLDTASRDTITSMKRGGSIFPDTPAQRQLDQSIASGVVNSIGPLATVWHGSPHKFDKFDSSKIGTGEGAQAYGHGLYLAESPDVAGSYAANLTTKPVRINGKALDEVLTDPNAQRFMRDANGDLELAKNLAKQEWMKYKKTEPSATMRSYVEEAQAQLNALDPLKSTIERPGSLYKVDLPDEAIAKMLDWDKPLSQQSASVQSWLKDPYNAYRNQLTAVDVGGNEPTGSLIMNRLQQLMSEGKKSDAFTNSANYGAANASRELADYGIPGIKYLDQGSRAANPSGQVSGGASAMNGARPALSGLSSNFVVFPGNESLLTILERNGQPLENLGLGR